MNILFCYQNGFSPTQGGVQRFCYNLSKYLEKKGHNVYYLSLKNDINFKQKVGEKYFTLPNSNILYHKSNHIYYKSLLVHKNIDIIINNETSNSRYSFFSNIGNKYTKHIAVYHQDPTYNLVNYADCRSLFCMALLIFKNVKRRLTFINILKQTDALVVLSSSFVENIKNYLGIKSEKIISISHFIEGTSDKLYLKKENIVLFVGRLEKEKQVDMLILVWDKIQKINKTWNLYIIGDGDEREKLELLIREKNISNIFFTGITNPNEWYNKAKIICLPSKHEGFGLVLVEAMARGVVPIAFDNWASLKDIIDHELNGIVVETKTENELKNSLIKVMHEETMQKIMAKNAIEKSKQFDVHNIGKKWEDLMFRMLKKRK